MDKTALITLITQKLQEELQAIKLAAESATLAATDEESKQEDKHDTRATEASYLARGQADRVTALERELQSYRNFPLTSYSERDGIKPGALIELQGPRGKRWVLLTPNSGGLSVKLGPTEVQTLSAKSPLGDALVGARVGDEVEAEGARDQVGFVVLRVL